MRNPKVIWELEPHTEAKHIILRNYLRAWFPIMGKYNSRLLFMDGYAGPGEYDKGEDGSPTIALKEAMNFLDYCDKHGWNKPEIVFKFIEQDPEKSSFLKAKLSTMHFPKQINVEILNSSFESVSKDIFEKLESKNAKLAPAFLFIDPFGYNLPFELIQKLMQHEKCEVFINFMYEFINRFIERDGQENVMNRLFGTDGWKKLNLDRLSADGRREAIHGFYQEQLEKRAAKYVRSFEMKGKRNATKYFLFYGTNHKKGLQKMKEAMWKVDTAGNYSFSDATNPLQGVLFYEEPNYVYLKKLLLEKFCGRKVSIEAIEDYVLCFTPFLTTHYKRQILAPMEKRNELIIISSDRKKSGSYPDGTQIQFK